MPKKQSVTVPLVAEKERAGYTPAHIDLKLSAEEANIARRAAQALDRAGERLENGRVVQTSPQAIRWILQQLARGNGKRTGA